MGGLPLNRQVRIWVGVGTVTVAAIALVLSYGGRPPTGPQLGAPATDAPRAAPPRPTAATSPSPPTSTPAGTREASPTARATPPFPYVPVPSTSPGPCGPDSASPAEAAASRTDLPNAYRDGVVRVRIAHCRDPYEVARRYGLPGPIWYFNRPPFDELDRRHGIDRALVMAVATGEEHKEAERLKTVGLGSDFDVVTLDWQFYACTEGCEPRPEVTPESGPRGTQFTLQFCCWPPGTPVEKRFTRPDGRLTILADAARSDRTVAAGWGGRSDDPLGTYSVKVRGGGIAGVLFFRIE